MTESADPSLRPYTPHEDCAVADRQMEEAVRVIRSMIRAWNRGEYCETSPAMKTAKEFMKRAGARL